MSTGEKGRNSEVIKLKVQLWHATGKERQPPTMTALARELNVSRQYVSKLIAQYTRPPVAVPLARGRSAREQIKAALAAKAVKGRIGAAKLWARMDAEDKDFALKQRGKPVSRDEERVTHTTRPRKTLRPQPARMPAMQPTAVVRRETYLARTGHAPVHKEENVVAAQADDEEEDGYLRQLRMQLGLRRT